MTVLWEFKKEGCPREIFILQIHSGKIFSAECTQSNDIPKESKDMFELISDILKYGLVIVVYVFIFSVVKLVYLDIADTRRLNKSEEEGLGYLKLINLRREFNFKVYESYSVQENSIIGRSKKCGIYIPDPYLSKQHARIFFKDAEFYIEDMGSTNGTRVNGKPLGVRPSKLKDNDKISIGHMNFLFVDSSKL